MKENPLPYSDEKAYRIAYLVAGYIRKTLTEAEHDELDAWVEASDANMLLFEELTDESNIEANLAWMESVQTEKALQQTSEQLEFSTGRSRKKRKIWPYAGAAAVLIAAVALYFLRPEKSNPSFEPAPVAAHEAPPGGNRATLTLGDGRVIDLAEKSDGLIENKTGTQIEKKGDGLLMYKKLTDAQQTSYNALTVPRGGQYALTLSDGTKVWLNALTSLKFPEQFTAGDRVVELSGEAFFEVAKDKEHPFIVKMADSGQVKVLGTQFNVNSYKNEESKKITLVEGRVEVTLRQAQGDRSLTLKPGEQARIKSGNLLLEKYADIEAVTGWKNGAFVFRDADIYTIVRQVERWYDVNVIYRTTTSEHFNFSLSRNEPLTKLLHLLELTGKVHFKIDNKTVYVLP